MIVPLFSTSWKKALTLDGKWKSCVYLFAFVNLCVNEKQPFHFPSMVIWHSDCCHEKDQTIDSLNESDFGGDIFRKMNLIYFAIDSKPVYSL